MQVLPRLLVALFLLLGLLAGPSLLAEDSPESAAAPSSSEGDTPPPVTSAAPSAPATPDAPPVAESATTGETVNGDQPPPVKPALTDTEQKADEATVAEGSELKSLQTETAGTEAGGSKGGFGYDTFRSTGEPITEGPVDDMYLIGPRDEIVVTIWGQLSETLNLVVSDEGYIDLPENGGRIQTNGVSLRELKPRIMEALSQIYSAYINAAEPSKSKAFIDIRLGKLRKLSLFVVGEVNKPGAYNVSPGVANVINLLHNAGGVRDTGSLREIRIRRTNGRVDLVDLYGFFLTGEIDFKQIRVHPGDYIIVPLKKKSVTVEGEVRRPNRYEIIGNEGVRELMEFAGGFTPDAYLKQSQIRRFEMNRGEVFLDMDLDKVMADPGQNVPLVDGDVVSITKNIQVRKNVVSIKGDGITRPGTFEWTPGMTLNDLIAKGEGLREYAYLDRADLVRTEDDFSKKLTVIALNDLYTKSENGKFNFTGNAEKNFPLREMDELVVQSAYGMLGKEQYVTMTGHVKEPGKFVLAKNMRLYDLLFARGGFQDAAFRKSTFMDVAHIFRKIPGTIGKKIIPFNLGSVLDQAPDANLTLEENDVIRIYSYDELAKKLEVHITGLVKNPGDYSMAEDLTLEDLLVQAGGLQPGVDKAEAVIARSDVEGSSRSVVVPISPNFTTLPKEQKTLLESGDKISITGLAGKDRYVTMEGHVKNPGKFILSKDMTLYDLVATRGGFQDATFKRATFTEMAHILRQIPNTIGLKIIPFNLAALLDKNPDANLPLEENDVVRIYSYEDVAKKQEVHVEGLIKNPGSYPMLEDLSLEDLLIQAGGLQPSVEKAEAIIARSDIEGSSRSIVVPIAPNFTTLPKEQRTLLESGDKISITGLAGKDRYVTMEGHVKNPGKFILSKDMTLYDLVATRGGFQDATFKKATFPDMAHVFRQESGTLGKKVIPFNLGALLNKDPSANFPLEENDVIRVYSYAEMTTTQVVSIDGLVKRPGSFPMAENLTLEDVIVMAGGLLPEAAKGEAAIARPEKDSNLQDAGPVKLLQLKVPVFIDTFATLPQDKRTALKPGDRITIRPQEGWEPAATVLITGEVNDPGNYELISKSERLSSLIKRAGGFKEEALLEGATVRRKQSIIRLGKGDESEYYEISVNLPAAVANPGGPEDLVLKDTDEISIPTNPGVVEVRGAVYRQLTLQHIPGRTMADYIALCGGYLDKADPSKIRIFSANKSAIPVKGKSQSLPPGSLIQVPFELETERMMIVEVKGAVEKPAMMQHVEGAPLGYYLRLSGGFKDDAAIEDISVLLPDGGLLTKKEKEQFNPVIPGGSLVMIPSKSQTNPK